jgi:hypothetical protein
VKFMETKVQITMTVKQARLQMRAMDLYMRILMGQFEEIEHMFFFFGEEGEKFKRKPEDHEKMHIHLKWLKKFVYPQLSENAYWGITGQPCPEEATMIYDMYKTMDNAISWHQNPKGGWTVNFDKPMHWYKELPLPEVKVFEDGQL